jgi:ribosome-associated translation inhibitor RaiA
MLIQFSTDHHIGHHPSLHDHVDALVRKTLHPFRSHITRVDVHLTDENAHANHANDKRCVMEARLDGVQPLVVTATASNVAAVLDAASRKLRRSVVRVEAKRRSRRVRTRLV